MSIDARPLKSGKTVYDVRLRDPHGRLYKRTFRTKREAERFQAGEVTDRARGAWVDPRLGRVTLSDYGSRWLANRPDLRPRTRELYQGLLRLHIIPALGHLELGAVTTSVVRSWRAGMLEAPRPGASTTEKCYRLLRAILNTAVQDEVIAKNPCSIKGAGVERPAERPTLTVPQVAALADAIAPEFRALVLTATFCGLRLGEMLALRTPRRPSARAAVRRRAGPGATERNVVARSAQDRCRPTNRGHSTSCASRSRCAPRRLRRGGSRCLHVRGTGW